MFNTYKRWSKRGYILWACVPINIVMACMMIPINKEAAVMYVVLTVFCLTAGYYFNTKAEQ